MTGTYVRVVESCTAEPCRTGHIAQMVMRHQSRLLRLIFGHGDIENFEEDLVLGNASGRITATCGCIFEPLTDPVEIAAGRLVQGI